MAIVKAVKAKKAFLPGVADLESKRNDLDQARPLNDVNPNPIHVRTPVIERGEKLQEKDIRSKESVHVHGHRKISVLLRLPGRDPARGRPESLPESRGIPAINVIVRARNHGIVLKNGAQMRIPEEEKRVLHHFQHCSKVNPIKVSEL